VAGINQKNNDILDAAQRRIEYLHSLIEASKAINSTLDLIQLLNIILNIAVQKTRAETGTIYVVDKNKNEIWSKVIHENQEEEFRLAIGQGIAGHVAASGETLNITDVYSHPRFAGSFDQQTGFRTRSMLCMPMRAENGDIIGVFQIINSQAGRFTTADEEFLSGLSVHAALAITKAALHQESVEKRAMEREMAFARNIQCCLLPAQLPVVRGYQFAASNLPAAAIGGDYYDFICTENGDISFVIGDVAGKGMPAALLMATLRTAIHALTFGKRTPNPGRFISRINRILRSFLPQSEFITLFYGDLSPKTGIIHYVNAGHHPPFYIKKNGDVKSLFTGGLTLGIKNEVNYKVREIKLEKGDVLFMYTDGVTEAMNARCDEYGESRLEACVTLGRKMTARGLIDAVLGEVNEFRGEAPQNDDITAAVIKRL
jgi:phosphoserine phosphatase RsbU/P